MRVMIKQLSFNDIVKAATRPTGLVLVLITAACLGAMLFWGPSSPYALATALGLGLIALVAILSVHVLALTRWMKLIEQRYELQSLASQQVTQSIAKFEAYIDAADLNVGRIAMLQARLDTRISEFERRSGRIPELEKGFDRAGVRMSELENGLERVASMLGRVETGLNPTKQKTVEPIISSYRRTSGKSNRP